MFFLSRRHFNRAVIALFINTFKHLRHILVQHVDLRHWKLLLAKICPHDLLKRQVCVLLSIISLGYESSTILSRLHAFAKIWLYDALWLVVILDALLVASEFEVLIDGL